MILHDSFEWTNATIGGVAFILTVATLFIAKGARKAAIEAREAVWKREASISTAKLISLSSELAVNIEAERFQAAQTRARDITSRIARDQARFRRFFSKDFHLLVDLEQRFSAIADRLSQPELFNTRDTVNEIANRVYEANRILSGICGRQESGLDQER